MSYGALNDPHINKEDSYAGATICSKFCSMGFVSSKKWVSTYITILDGMYLLLWGSDYVGVVGRSYLSLCLFPPMTGLYHNCVTGIVFFYYFLLRRN